MLQLFKVIPVIRHDKRESKNHHNAIDWVLKTENLFYMVHISYKMSKSYHHIYSFISIITVEHLHPFTLSIEKPFYEVFLLLEKCKNKSLSGKN